MGVAGSRDDVVVLSGSPRRYSDPWHPFAATSSAVAHALEARGREPRIETDADHALAQWAGGSAPHPSLLVVNIGWYGEAEAFAADAALGLEAVLRAGVPMLVLHSSLTAFPNWPRWEQITGGRWVYDVTYHPDRGAGQALVATDHHPVTDGLRDFDIVDERYTRLRVAPTSHVFLEHEEDGERHPLAWTHHVGRSRVISNALGHDADAYGPGRLALLDREIDWLFGGEQ